MQALEEEPCQTFIQQTILVYQLLHGNNNLKNELRGKKAAFIKSFLNSKCRVFVCFFLLYDMYHGKFKLLQV